MFVDGTSATIVTLVNITHCYMIDNSASRTASTLGTTGSGGALYIEGGVSSMSNTNFSGNSAVSYGGGVVYDYGCFNLSSVPGGSQSCHQESS